MTSPQPAFGDYQLEIYLAGLQGVLPSFPMAFAELEARAERALPPSVLSYVAGGAGSERTQRANVSAFAQWGLIPRMLVGAARRDLSVDLFGMRLPSPLLMAPIGVIGLCAQDGHGDLATADAAARTGVPMIASTLSADPLEDVAARFDGTPGFFQLYTPTDRDLAASLVSRAEAAGFRGIVVTLDTWVTGWRPRDLAASNFPQLRGHCLANYTSDPVFRALLGQDSDPAAAVGLFARLFGNPLTWDDLPWLRSLTTLPRYPAASARDTRLAARSRSVGVYSWKKPGVPPNCAATSSRGSTDRVEAIIGTPVRSAATAAARSPCPSWAHRPMTPIGAMSSGDGSVIPNSSTDRSRSAAPTNIRGIRPHRPNALTLARWVCSAPAPPAT